MSICLRSRRIFILLVIFILLPLLPLGAVQSLGGSVFGGGFGGKKRAATPVTPPTPSSAPKPELMDADSNPTLRYPVAVFWGSYGWLDVMRSSVRYTVVVGGEGSNPSPSRHAKMFAAAGGSNFMAAPPPVRKDVIEGMQASMDGFEIALSDIKDIQFEKGVLLLQTSSARIELAYLPQSQWGQTQSERDFNESAQSNVGGTMAIERGMRNFDAILAEVKPAAAAVLDVALHAEPSSVEKGHAVSLVWTSSNATSLDLQPGVGKVAAAGGMNLQPQESTTYTLTAIGPAGTKMASVHVDVAAATPPPTLVLTEPSVAEGQTIEVASSPLVIQGVVMDASGMPVVSVNGNAVTMRPTSTQAAQFKSDPINLQAGENHFEVSAVNNSQGKTKVDFIVRLSAAPQTIKPAEPANPKGLSKDDILSLLRGEVPNARVAELVRQRGLKFLPSMDDFKDFRKAGGNDELITTINQAAASQRVYP